MFDWKVKQNITASNAIFLEDNNGQEGRPFKARFLQAGLVKYDFGVCLLKKETIDKFINTFIGTPVIIGHSDDIKESDKVGVINKIWFSAEDGWFWCEGLITDDKAIELIENGYNVSCQYRITDYSVNAEGKLHNANPYDKEILNGVFEHLAIVENPRYEDAFIAVNAYIAENTITDVNGAEHNETNGQFTEKNNANSDFQEKAKSIKPIHISKESIPQFKSKKELSNWMKEQFEQLGSVKIDDTGIDLKLSAGKADREAIKRRSLKEENKAVVSKFEEIVSQAIKKDERKADERHNKDQEIYYNKFEIDGEEYEVDIFVDMPYGTDKNSYYAGHSAAKIKVAPRDTMNVSNDLTHYAKSANTIIPYLEIDFNPNATNSIETKYKKVFGYLKTTKGEPMDNETKTLFASLIDALKARNEEDKKEDKKDDDKASNEDTDKRKLIDEIGGILKGKVDEELWRTIIGKAEKLAYTNSEADTADNEDVNKKEAKNKCRNEEVDKRDLIRQIMAIAGKHEDNEDVREIAKLAEKLAYDKSEAGTADNKAKNEEEKLYEELKEKVEKEAENKKAKNSLDALKKAFYEGEEYKPDRAFMSQKEGIELGKKLY